MALINCPKCGAMISDKAEKCVKCGNPMKATVGGTTSGLTYEQKNTMNTGTLQQGSQIYTGANTGMLQQTTGMNTGMLQQVPVKKNNKKLIGIIVGAVAIVVVVAVILLLSGGKKPEDIQLSKHTASVDVGSNIRLDYFISPDEASDAEVEWISSNESVARVSDGNVTGVSEGDCEITVRTKNGKKDRCTIVVEPAKPDFRELYNRYCRSSWATLSSDNTTLTIDTNPYDRDDYYEYAAGDAIECLNREMGFSDSLMERMGSTRALDGTQTAESKTVEVSWTYHPDKGLRVVYSLKY